MAKSEKRNAKSRSTKEKESSQGEREARCCQLLRARIRKRVSQRAPRMLFDTTRHIKYKFSDLRRTRRLKMSLFEVWLTDSCD